MQHAASLFLLSETWLQKKPQRGGQHMTAFPSLLPSGSCSSPSTALLLPLGLSRGMISTALATGPPLKLVVADKAG